MSEELGYTQQDGVVVLTLRFGKVNALGLALRTALYHAIERAQEDAQCQAIVLTGHGAIFSAGADINEFNTPKAQTQPTLGALLQRIHASAKPIVAAMNGTALGGGLELALAAHYRVMHATASIGLPEVNLGLVPGAGGTQRLPRIVGIGAAATLIATAQRVEAASALRLGLVEQVSEEDVVADAVALAQQKSAGFVAHTLDLPPVIQTAEDTQQLQEIKALLAKRKRGYHAPMTAIACVEQTAQLPLSAGLAYERSRFQELVEGTESKALRYLFQAERHAHDGIQGIAPAADFSRAAVIGGGLMGRGIIMCLLDAGLDVVLIEQTAQAMNKALDAIAKAYDKQVEKSQLSRSEHIACMQRLAAATELSAIGKVDVVIEAVIEDMAVKQAVFAQLDKVCGPETVFASNTSRLDINQLAAGTRRPERFLGLHFFSPANRMPLLEVVQGTKTSPTVMAQAMRFAKRLRKIAVPVGVCEGFVGNRMLTAYRREASFLLEEGASVADVDTALYDFGMAMGPFVMTDMAGLEISWAARKRLAATRDPTLRDSRVGDRLCEMGRFGQKTQAGYYRYEAGSRQPLEDPVVAEVIQQCAQEAGIVPQPWHADDIVKRAMYALINEGVHLLAEGIARRASDIDLVYVHGYGFPAYRGGPMFYADTIGLASVYNQIREWEQQFGRHWTPSPLFAQLVQKQQRLSDYVSE